jgi:hypothetical protein
MQTIIQPNKRDMNSKEVLSPPKKKQKISREVKEPTPQASSASIPASSGLAVASAITIPEDHQRFPTKTLGYKDMLGFMIFNDQQLLFLERTSGRIKGSDERMLLHIDSLELTNKDWKNHYIRMPIRAFSHASFRFCGIDEKAADTLFKEFYHTPDTAYWHWADGDLFRKLMAHVQAHATEYLRTRAAELSPSTAVEKWGTQLNAVGFTPKACAAILDGVHNKLNILVVHRKFAWIADMAIKYSVERFEFLHHVRRLMQQLANPRRAGEIYEEWDRKTLEKLAEKLLSDGDIFFEVFPKPEDLRLDMTPQRSTDSEYGFLRTPYVSPTRRPVRLPASSEVEPASPAPTSIVEETVEDVFDEFIDYPADSP